MLEHHNWQLTLPFLVGLIFSIRLTIKSVKAVAIDISRLMLVEIIIGLVYECPYCHLCDINFLSTDLESMNRISGYFSHRLYYFWFSAPRKNLRLADEKHRVLHYSNKNIDIFYVTHVTLRSFSPLKRIKETMLSHICDKPIFQKYNPFKTPYQHLKKQVWFGDAITPQFGHWQLNICCNSS